MPRVYLTKSERASEAGVELIALCEGVTADGQVSFDEIAELRVWLNKHADVDLPSFAFLRETVTRILADGVVTPAEAPRDVPRT